MQILIAKLHEMLKFLDENELAVPALKVEEAINALQPQAEDRCEPMKRRPEPE